MKKAAILVLLFITASAAAQSNKSPGGQFSLGVRSTTSLFSNAGKAGTGFGGQFRIRFYPALNSEWFADYLTSRIGTLGTRTDYHIGWSVMFYLTSQKASRIGSFRPYRPKPYFLAGHCFDYTRIRGNNPFYAAHSDFSRWSSAVQTGFGMHVPMTPIVDLSASAQYMMHLGKDIHAETRTAGNGDEFLYVESHSAGLEGHVLLTISLNVQLADLWKDKRGALGNGTHIQED
jgi:hypothetical protein